jgi:hypothetical protein
MASDQSNNVFKFIFCAFDIMAFVDTGIYCDASIRNLDDKMVFVTEASKYVLSLSYFVGLDWTNRSFVFE